MRAARQRIIIPFDCVVKCHYSRNRLPEWKRAEGTVQDIDPAVPRLRRKNDLLPNLKAVARAIEQIDRAIVDTGRFMKRQVRSVGKEAPIHLAGTCEFRYYAGNIISHPTHVRDV